MYSIRKSRGRTLNGMYFTYEEARSALRKILREFGFTSKYRNPSISNSGYHIVKVS